MPRPAHASPSRGRGDVLDRVPVLGWLARRRWFPLAVTAPMLVVLALLLTAGMAGTAVGSGNALVVLVWILWWILLIAVLVPLASRAWCGVCPIPFLGDWFQRGSLLGVRTGASRAGGLLGRRRLGRNTWTGFNRRWPRALSNIWLQSLAFLLLATFSAVLLTDPLASAAAVGALVLLATVTAIVFEKRTFCRYLCPVSGFVGLYSSASALVVTRRDDSTCDSCRDRGCVAGNERAWGCPWLEQPYRMDRASSCGFCLECIKACPSGNMTVLLRPPFGAEPLRGWDEAFKAWLMLALALAYSVVYLGPWGAPKDAANVVVSGDWPGFLAFASGLWLFALVFVPGLFLAAAALGRLLAGRPVVPWKAAVVSAAAAAVPLGLLAWIAFSVPLVLVNGSYVLGVISDPFGWGWNLLGTARVPWTPVGARWMPFLQAGLILAGQALAMRAGWTASLRLYGDRARALKGFGPLAALVAAVSVASLWLHVG